MATVRCIPQIKRFMEFYDDYLSKEEDDNGVLIAIENLFYSALQVLECYSEDRLIVSINSKDEFLSVCIVIGESVTAPDGTPVPNSVFVATLRKLISLLNVEIEVNRSFFSLATDTSTIPGFRTRELEKGFIELRIFGEIAATGEIAMKQDVLIQPQVPAGVRGTPLCDVSCVDAEIVSPEEPKRSWPLSIQRNGSLSSVSSVAYRYSGRIVVMMMYPFKYCLEPTSGVSTLKARAFMERRRLLGDNRGTSFCVSNFDSSDSGIDGRETELKEELEKLEQEPVNGNLGLDAEKPEKDKNEVSGRYKGLDSERPSDLGEAAAFQGEVPTSPMAFKKIAAAKAVAEAEEAATKQAAATAKARYMAAKALEDVEAARRRQEVVVDAAKAAAEKAARDADDEATKQSAALAQAAAAFKSLAAAKEEEVNPEADEPRRNPVKKSRSFFGRRGSKAPSRDVSANREPETAKRGKSVSRRESKDKGAKRPSVVEATADVPSAKDGTLERRKSLFGREKSNLEKQQKTLERKEKEARKKEREEKKEKEEKEPKPAKLKKEKSFVKESKESKEKELKDRNAARQETKL